MADINNWVTYISSKIKEYFFVTILFGAVLYATTASYKASIEIEAAKLKADELDKELLVLRKTLNSLLLISENPDVRALSNTLMVKGDDQDDQRQPMPEYEIEMLVPKTSEAKKNAGLDDSYGPIAGMRRSVADKPSDDSHLQKRRQDARRAENEKDLEAQQLEEKKKKILKFQQLLIVSRFKKLNIKPLEATESGEQFATRTLAGIKTICDKELKKEKTFFLLCTDIVNAITSTPPQEALHTVEQLLNYDFSAQKRIKRYH